jgi:hypothetical protein
MVFLDTMESNKTNICLIPNGVLVIVSGHENNGGASRIKKSRNRTGQKRCLTVS